MGVKHATLAADPGLIDGDDWDADHVIDGPLSLPLEPSTPAALTDRLKIFAQRRANRSLLRMIGQNGIDVSLQPAIFGNSMAFVLPLATTNVSAIGMQMAVLNAGTAAALSTLAPSGTNDLNSVKRTLFNTGTTATGASGYRSNTADYYRGNAPGRGGWFMVFRFGVETFASDLRIKLGMYQSNAALNAEPSTFTNAAGLIKDSTDANWHFAHNDASGVATKINTGVVVTAGQVLDLFIFCPPQGSSISFMLMDVVAGTVLAEHTATTDLPVATTFLFAKAAIQSVTGTSSKALAMLKMYIEADL